MSHAQSDKNSHLQTEDHNQLVLFLAMLEEQNVIPQPKKRKAEKPQLELRIVRVPRSFLKLMKSGNYFYFASQSNITYFFDVVLIKVKRVM